MMKILSLIVFVILLSWTWHVVHSNSPIDFETHSDIQAKMKELIESTIKSRKPDTKSVEIIKIWTQDMGERKIRADFTYKFIETDAKNESTERMIDGEAILSRDVSDNPSLDQWTVQSLKTKGDSISFNEGSTVSPDNQSNDENPSSTEPRTPPTDNPMTPAESTKTK
jgi:Co/Zn/Cd efflux system component